MQNIRNCSYIELFQGLSMRQVAPPLFLVLSKFIISIFNGTNSYINDFVPKIIPFISGILSIFVFNIFINKFVKNNSAKIFALALFCLNPFTICYSAIFKQYSTELLISVTLLYIFYNMIFENKFKWSYATIIFFTPWFSLSSIFITIPTAALYFFKYKTEFLKRLFIPITLSFILFYVLYLNPTLSSSYHNMSNGYEHLYFNLFGLSKKICFTFIMSKLIFICSLILLASKKKWEEKYFLLAPIVLTLIVSSMHYYFMYIRLHLFLFPIYILILCEYKWELEKVFKIILCTIFLLASLYYTVNPIKWTYISTATSGRQISDFVHNNIQPNDILVYGNDDIEFNYYFPQERFPQKRIKIPYWYRTQEKTIKSELKKLPAGTYWYIFMYPIKDKKIITPEIGSIEKEIYLNSNAVKFIK